MFSVLCNVMAVRCIKLLSIVLVALFANLATAAANPKYAGLVIDVISGDDLYADNADAYRYPASLTKIMTLYIVFEEMEAGRLTLSSKLKMSEYAAARPPSKLWIPAGGTITVRDAIKALVTKSANDVASAVGENIEGSEAAFARRMTKTARRLGMTKTTFRNASGLPNSQQKTTARDMATLGIAIQRDFPQYYGVFSTRTFEFRKKRYGNHNRLLGRVQGVDGIKTGFIRASGFNLVTSVRRDGRHVVAVVMGGRTGASRNRHMTDLIGRYLPKAKRGEPMPVYAWNDDRPPPVPRAKPLRELYLARLKSQQDAPKIASPDGDDPIAGLVAFAAETRAAAPSPEANGALQAVIAQGSVEAVIASAPLPSPDEVQSTVRSKAVRAALGSASKTASPVAGTRTAPTTTTIEIASAPPIDAPSDQSSRVDGAFSSLQSATQPSDIADLIRALSKKTVSAPTTASPRGTVEPSGWQIQVGAVPSPEKVEELQETSEAIVPDLKARTRVMSEVKTSKGKMFRARYAGFASQEAAQAVCKRFIHQKRPCWAVSM